MARLFNVVLFDETISGGTTTPPIYYSNQNHQALLGSADVLTVQLIVEAIGTATTTVSVVYQISNTANDSEWKDSSKSETMAVAGFSPADLPASKFFAVDANIDLAAFGRFKITSDKNPPCKVKIVACGRSL